MKGEEGTEPKGVYQMSCTFKTHYFDHLVAVGERLETLKQRMITTSYVSYEQMSHGWIGEWGRTSSGGYQRFVPPAQLGKLVMMTPSTDEGMGTSTPSTSSVKFLLRPAQPSNSAAAPSSKYLV